MLLAVSWRSQEWCDEVDAVRFNCMKRKAFCNMAWQMFVTACKERGELYVRSGSAASRDPAPSTITSKVGALHDAVRAAKPNLGPVEIAAEEFVEITLRHKIIDGVLPVGVCSPNDNPAWNNHNTQVHQQCPK